MNQLAFEYEWKFFDKRRIYNFWFYRCQPTFWEFVFIPARYNSKIICLNYIILWWNVDGESLPFNNVFQCVSLFLKRDRNTWRFWTWNSTPGCSHYIWFFIHIIRPHNKNRGWIHNCFCSYRFFHLFSLQNNYSKVWKKLKFIPIISTL